MNPDRLCFFLFFPFFPAVKFTSRLVVKIYINTPTLPTERNSVGDNNHEVKTALASQNVLLVHHTHLVTAPSLSTQPLPTSTTKESYEILTSHPTHRCVCPRSQVLFGFLAKNSYAVIYPSFHPHSKERGKKRERRQDKGEVDVTQFPKLTMALILGTRIRGLLTSPYGN